MIRIALVEDHLMVRQTLKRFLGEIDGFKIVEEAECGAEYERKYSPDRIDITLLDLRLRGQHGLTTCRNLVKKYPKIRIIIVSAYDDADTVLCLVREGASGFISKGDDISVMETTIRNVNEYGFYFNKDIGSMMRMEVLKIYKRRTSGDSTMPEFSVTELKIAMYICNQRDHKQIAEELRISVRTVESHKRAMVEKTFSLNFNGVIVYLFKNHYLYPGDMETDVALRLPE